jgi:hypothetical protein
MKSNTLTVNTSLNSGSNFNNFPKFKNSKTSKMPGDKVIRQGTAFELEKIIITGEETKINSDYTNVNLNQLFSNEEFIKKISKIFNGFKPDLNFPRVLLVTHSGFIMEFLNSIRITKNIRIKFINDSEASALYILKIYCLSCGAICYSKDSNCKLEFDMIIYNDTGHLKFINK